MKALSSLPLMNGGTPPGAAAAASAVTAPLAAAASDASAPFRKLRLAIVLALCIN